MEILLVLLPAITLSACTPNPSITCHHKLNNVMIDLHYEVDLNQDGQFGGDEDTFAGKYNFYVMTSSASFSCANHLSTICRNMNFGKVICERNGGGSCIISFLSNSSGYLYHSSSQWTSLLYENEQWVTNDNGVEPDILLSSDYFYNHAYIDNLLSN